MNRFDGYQELPEMKLLKKSLVELKNKISFFKETAKYWRKEILIIYCKIFPKEPV